MSKRDQRRLQSVQMVFGGSLCLSASGIWTYDLRVGKDRIVKSTRQRDFDKAVEIARRMSARTHMTEQAFGKVYESDYFDVYKNCRKNAQKRGIPFDLTTEQFDSIVRRSEGACALTGVVFQRVRNIGPYERQPFFPSIDRIDSRGGYTANNVRLLCTAANLAINSWGDWVLFELANAIQKRPEAVAEKTTRLEGFGSA